jgi:hypothetical protein
LTTSEAFADFRYTCADTTTLKIYRLAEWVRKSKRQFAWLALEGCMPKAGEHDSADVNAFMIRLDHSHTLDTLCGLPFYCDLLLRQHEAGTMQEFPDDVALLNSVVDEMVNREVKKGLLDLRLFEPDGLNAWLELIAVDYVEGQRYADINCNQAMEYGQLVLRADLDDETRHHILTSLLQFPLFRAGKNTGLIGFTHDLIAEALAARDYVRVLAREPRQVAER